MFHTEHICHQVNSSLEVKESLKSRVLLAESFKSVVPISDDALSTFLHQCRKCSLRAHVHPPFISEPKKLVVVAPNEDRGYASESCCWERKYFTQIPFFRYRVFYLCIAATPSASRWWAFNLWEIHHRHHRRSSSGNQSYVRSGRTSLLWLCLSNLTFIRQAERFVACWIWLSEP